MSDAIPPCPSDESHTVVRFGTRERADGQVTQREFEAPKWRRLPTGKAFHVCVLTRGSWSREGDSPSETIPNSNRRHGKIHPEAWIGGI